MNLVSSSISHFIMFLSNPRLLCVYVCISIINIYIYICMYGCVISESSTSVPTKDMLDADQNRVKVELLLAPFLGFAPARR